MKRGARSRKLVAACVAALLLAAVAAVLGDSAARPAMPEAQNMLGVWQGFFQGPPPDDSVPVRSEITSQENRRFGGVMGIVPRTLELNGTVAASGRVNLQAGDADSHGIANPELHDFGGGAAILNGGLMLHFTDGRMSDGTLLLLRAFGAIGPCVVPNPAGSYLGAFRNTDGTSGEISALLIGPPDDTMPTSFPGQVVIVLGGGRHTFELKGTINCDGRLIAIAQAAAGHLILNTMFTGPPDDGTPAMITGQHTLELNDGTVHEGTFQMTAESPR
jgi:hypothetical protein